jgi:predicted MFS family arabinose efflux permease
VAVGLADASLALLVYGVVVVACRLLFAKVPDRLPSLPLGAAALLVTAAGLALMAIGRTPGGLLVGVFCVAVGVSFSTPAFFSAIFASAKPGERGAASGTASAVVDLGLGFGPIALGLVADSYGIPWAFGAEPALRSPERSGRSRCIAGGCRGASAAPHPGRDRRVRPRCRLRARRES